MLAINFLLSIHIVHAFWIYLTETKEGLALNDLEKKLESIALNYIYVRLPGFILMNWDFGRQ